MLAGLAGPARTKAPAEVQQPPAARSHVRTGLLVLHLCCME